MCSFGLLTGCFAASAIRVLLYAADDSVTCKVFVLGSDF